MPLARLLSLALVVASLSCSSAMPEAQRRRLEMELEERATFYGGWALVADSCPSGTNVCGTRTCCPTNTNCEKGGAGWSDRCCPGTNDCYSAVMQVPICADTTWWLWNTTKEPICCLPGQQGTNPDSGWYGNCLPSDVAVPSTALGTLIATGGAPAATTGTGSPTVTQATYAAGKTTATTSSPTSTAESSNNSNNNSGHSGLSNTALKAIIGAAVGVAILAIILVWFFRRRNKKWYEKKLAEMPMMYHAAPPPARMSSHQIKTPAGTFEPVPTSPPHENMPGSPPPLPYYSPPQQQQQPHLQEVDGLSRVPEYRYELGNERNH